MSDQNQYEHYSMVVEWESEGEVYVVTVPELPGCRTHGETRQEAVLHGSEVIELWIDTMRDLGRPIPAPKYFALDSVDDLAGVHR